MLPQCCINRINNSFSADVAFYSMTAGVGIAILYILFKTVQALNGKGKYYSYSRKTAGDNDWNKYTVTESNYIPKKDIEAGRLLGGMDTDKSMETKGPWTEGFLMVNTNEEWKNFFKRKKIKAHTSEKMPENIWCLRTSEQILIQLCRHAGWMTCLQIICLIFVFMLLINIQVYIM